MPFAAQGLHADAASLRDVRLTPFWLDDPSRPEPTQSLIGTTTADLAVIGGGFAGLWTAYLAKTADPSRDVVVLEGDRVAQGAAGRNGGFVSASLTHGFSNGLARWPSELRVLTDLGLDNLDAIEQFVASNNVDCDFMRSGSLDVATEPYQVQALIEIVREAAAYGHAPQFLDREQIQALVHSPTYLGALFDARGTAMVNPARLAWGLRQACLDLGVRLFEHSPASGIDDESASLQVRTPYGMVTANRVAMATNAFPPLLKRLKSYIVPVYDYVLMTEPLTAAQRDSIGWSDRQGMSDGGNQFHYYRLTDDGRILWGGYDASYHWGSGFGTQFESDHESWNLLATHFFQTFPQLEGLQFSHAWGGAIDTCSRFSAFWGRAYQGRAAYVAGFTGLGVGASRFGAQVMLDLLDGHDTERTGLEMVRTKPLPFPPEPLRSLGISLTRRSLDQADRNDGKRNLWLKTLDRLGLGFDS